MSIEDRLDKLPKPCNKVCLWLHVHRMLISFLILTAAFAYTVNQLHETERGIQLETRRACIRNNINSALVALSSAGESNEKKREAREAIGRNLYPVIECEESQLTRHTVVLNEKETQKYIDIIAKGRAPLVEKGKVIGSAPTLWHKLDRIEQEYE